MKRLVSVAVVMSAMLTSEAKDATWQWREQEGLSADAMADWFTPQNWLGESVADASTDNALFTAGATGLRFVAIDRALSIASLKGKSGCSGYGNADRQIVVSDYPITFTAAGSFLEHMDVYADIIWPAASANVTHATVAGDVHQNDVSQPVALNEHLNQRLDLYANAQGGVRRDFFSCGSLMKGSYGDFKFFAPQSAANDVKGRWTTTKNSRVLHRVGTAHVIPVGTWVSGEGIPANAWVKRIFDDATIEISAAATATSEPDVELTFAAQTADVYAHVALAQRGTKNNRYFIRLNKFRPEDNFRFEIDEISNQVGFGFPFRTDEGFYPGTFVLHNVPGGSREVILGTCHLEFAKPTMAGLDAGMPYQPVKMDTASDVARLTVTNNISAIIAMLTDLVGTVTKDGAGRLTVGLSDRTEANTGRLSVEEGVFEIADTGAESFVGTLHVAAGAEIVIPAAGLRVRSLELEEGAIVTGPGAIRVAQLAPSYGVVYENGGEVVYDGPSANVCYAEPPPTNVVGTPALWMDVSKESSLTVVSEGDVEYVTQMNDVRGAGFPTATLYAAGGRPSLVRDASGKSQHVYFERTTGTTPRQGLKWNKEITGIRAVFKVMSALEGGGNFLGSTDANHRDFWHDEWGSGSIYTSSVFFHEDENPRPDYIVNAAFYVNGERRDWRTGYPYPGGSTGKTADKYVPLVAEVHPTAPGAWANCFSFVQGGTSRTGRERLYEVLVYTNELSHAERLAVTGYLMKKWLNAEVDYAPVEESSCIMSLDASADVTVGVDAGRTARVAAVSGSASVRKVGAGTLCVDDYSNVNGGFDVFGGTLQIKSEEVSLGTLPSGAYLHLDAAATDTIHMDGVNVVGWDDVRGGDYRGVTVTATGTGDYKMADETLAGVKLVDLIGSEGKLPKVLEYTPSYDLRSVFIVSGTRTYGGTLIGHRQSGARANMNGHLYGLWHEFGGKYGPENTPDVFLTASDYTTAWVPGCPGIGGTHTRLNGADVIATEVGFTHHGDLVSFTTQEPIYGDCLSCGWRLQKSGSDVFYWGGQSLGEYILYRETLSRESVRRIESYLNRKWFGRETVGYRSAKVGHVTVAEGATLSVYGNCPVTVSSLKGAGTVDGAVILANQSEFVVPVANGSVQTLALTGELLLGGSATVRVTGDAATLPKGDHVLLTAAEVPSANWTLVVENPHRSRDYALVQENGKLILRVTGKGICVIVR